MRKSNVMSVSLPKHLIRKINEVAENGGHTKSFIVKLALTKLVKDSQDGD